MTDTELKELLSSAKNIAVVGLSNSPARASYGVSRFLQRQGYRVIPVNPNETEVLGETCYPTLREVPDPIDIVDIFRRSEAVPEIVDAALERHAAGGGIRCIWMQEGIVNTEAAARAEAAGIPVVMNHCILKELARLFPH